MKSIQFWVVYRMTEKEVFESLMKWLKDRGYDKLVNLYWLNENKDKRKELSKKFLKFRLKLDPNFFYLLPTSIIEKLGFKMSTDVSQVDDQEGRLRNFLIFFKGKMHLEYWTKG